MKSTYFYSVHIIIGLLFILIGNEFYLWALDFFLKMGLGVVWATVATFLSVFFLKEKRKSFAYWLMTWVFMNASIHWLLLFTFISGANNFFR